MTTLHHKKAGFSLVETLFAIAILMIALVGPLTLSWSALSASNDQRNEVVGSYLAQESIEYIKNQRDVGVVQTPARDFDAVLTGALSACAGGNPCDPEPITGAVVSCAATGCPIYRVTNTIDGSSWYTSNGTLSASQTKIDSGFTRKTVITSGHAAERFVTVTVSWKNHAISRSMSISEVLYKI